MIIETKIFWVEEGTPTEEDIEKCVKISNEEHLRVWIHWFGPDNVYYGGYHQLFINPGSTFDEVWNRIPKVYAV